MNHAGRSLTSLVATALLAACGSASEDLELGLEAPTPREARVALTPALDVGALTNSALADRIVIDEIYVSVAEIRLLGGNPQIPAGGLRLASGGQVLSNDQAGFGHFPFPSSFLSDDLAVFVRIGRSTELRGASVVVKARLYEDAPVAYKLSLTADDDEAPNPDGEPAKDKKSAPNPDGEPANGEAPNPDGEPANDEAPNPDGEPANDEAPNPDGEPAHCGGADNEDGMSTNCLTARSRVDAISQLFEREARYVPFELRGEDVADLVISFEQSSRLNVLLAIPGDRWFTPQVVQRLENRLSEVTQQPLGSQQRSGQEPTSVVVTAPDVDRGVGEGRDSVKSTRSDYRLVDEREGNPSGLR